MDLASQEIRFKAADIERLAAAGLLPEDARLELLDGRLLEMTPASPEHASTVKRLTKALRSQLVYRALLGIHDPVQLNEFTVLVPDLSLLQPRDDFYSSRHPRPADVILLIEVSLASLPYDTLHKVPRYAEAGIRQLWIVDLEARAIRQYTRPANDEYERLRLVRAGDVAVVRMPAALGENIELAHADVFG